MIVVGIDEVGRGCLAGPVSACAYAFHGDAIPAGLKDSKKLSAKKREAMVPELESVGWFGHGSVEAEEIDAIGILPATFLAMHRALLALKDACALEWSALDVVVDGNLLPKWKDVPAEVVRCLVKADDTVKAVSAASVLAKVKRDRLMAERALLHPGYGFEQHAGYGTAAHIDAIRNVGVTPQHRKTFEPIRSLLASAI